MKIYNGCLKLDWVLHSIMLRYKLPFTFQLRDYQPKIKHCSLFIVRHWSQTEPGREIYEATISHPF